MIAAAAGLLGALGVGAGVVGVACRHARQGIALMLDLWVAAGLLRLTASSSWEDLATAATLVLLRKLLVASLSTVWRAPSAPRLQAGHVR